MSDSSAGDPFLWTDTEGRVWEIIDFRLDDFGAKKKRVPLSHHTSEGRAFIPHGWNGPTRALVFRGFAYRTTDDRTLANQFRYATIVRSASDRSADDGREPQARSL